MTEKYAGGRHMQNAYEGGSAFGPVLQGLLFAVVITLHMLLLALLFERQYVDNSYQALSALVFFLAYGIFRRYDWLPRWEIGRVGSMGTRIMAAWIGLCGTLIVIAFMTKQSTQFSRLVLTLWMLSTPVVLLTVHLAIRYGVLRFFPKLAYSRNAVVVFASSSGTRLARAVSEMESPRHNVLGFFEDRSPDRIEDLPEGMPILGRVSELSNYVNNNKVEVVYVVLPAHGMDRAAEVLAQLDDTMASIYYVPDFRVFDLSHLRFANVGGVPAMLLTESPFFGADGMLKRILDIVLASTALLLFLPVFIGVMLAILITMGRPIFFSQRRYGLSGEEIKVHKFRSMRNLEDGAQVTQATRNDPRVTPLGSFLRRTSIDEWPQFWNVLKGEMSVVGPRPHAVVHNEAYRKLISRYMSRHKVKPGLTGWAQVNGLRGETQDVEFMERRVQYDLDYIRTWSPELDIRIIFKTAWMIFRDKAAY